MTKKNDRPLVTIITVVYNGDKYLEQTIESVINQTYKNIEYIIIDGGSTDGTIDIIKKYEKHISYWVSESDDGLYDAMNKGIKLAKGELIGMINSDDWYELDAVEKVVKNYLVTKKYVYHGNVNIIESDNKSVIRKFHPSKWKFILYGMTYMHPTFFVHRKVYQKFLYDTKLKALSDYQFTLQVYIDSPKNFEYLDTVIANFRVGGISGNMSLNERLIEGYQSRNNAGLNIFLNYIAILIRYVLFYVVKIKNKIFIFGKK